MRLKFHKKIHQKPDWEATKPSKKSTKNFINNCYTFFIYYFFAISFNCKNVWAMFMFKKNALKLMFGIELYRSGFLMLFYAIFMFQWLLWCGKRYVISSKLNWKFVDFTWWFFGRLLPTDTPPEKVILLLYSGLGFLNFFGKWKANIWTCNKIFR